MLWTFGKLEKKASRLKKKKKHYPTKAFAETQKYFSYG